MIEQILEYDRENAKSRPLCAIKTVRNHFLYHLVEVAKEASGASGILRLGAQEHKKYATQYPNARIRGGAGHPDDSKVRELLFSVSHSSAQKKYKRRPNIVFELVLTTVVQLWFDFLTNVYSITLAANLKGPIRFDIPASNIRIDLSLTADKVVDSMFESAVRDFDFQKAATKFRIIRKALAMRDSDIDDSYRTIAANIQIRNILQHRHGIVSAKDLQDIGVNRLEEDHGKRTEHRIAGDRVTRTAFDIENLARAMNDVANALVRDEVSGGDA